MSTTLVGVFDDSAQAQKASEKLQERGIDQQSIQMSQRQSSTPSAAGRGEGCDRPLLLGPVRRRRLR